MASEGLGDLRRALAFQTAEPLTSRSRKRRVASSCVTHAAREAARAAATKADEADARARKLVEQAEAGVAAFGDLDGEVAEHRAAAIREGRDPSEIPLALAERIKARAEAEAKVASYGAARALLAGEAKAAADALGAAEANVSSAAADVLLAEAEEIADKVAAAQAEAQARLGDLVGVAAVWVAAAGKPGPLPLPPRLRDFIAQAGGPRHDPRWQNLMKALSDGAVEATFV